MVKKRVLDPMPALDEALLLQALREEGIKELHARAVWGFALAEGKMHGSDATFDNFEQAEFHMNAPAPTGPLLRKKFAILTSTVVEKQLSEDGTVKLLVRLQDGQMVETVIIQHGGTHPRTTLCVSSQVGCQMACTFCATGTMGLKGDLSAGEILEQVLHASRVAPIRNVVFMGMGEPLNNYDAVLTAIRGMSDSRMFKLSPRHITLSTVGVVPRMKQLTKDAPETQLALSLHAPNQELRNKIVPSARAYRLDKLMDALDGHLRGPNSTKSSPSQSSSHGEAKTQENAAESVPVGHGGEIAENDEQGLAGAHEEADLSIAGVMVGGKGAGRRALIEYVMLAGVNDTEECGRELGQLLQGRNVLVNLIPYNPTYAPGSEEFQEPTEEALQAFKKIVHEHGLLVTIRRHHGRDIDGACGQLAIKIVANGASSSRTGNSGCSNGKQHSGDIEDLISGKGSTTRHQASSKKRKSGGDNGPKNGNSAETPKSRQLSDRVGILVEDDQEDNTAHGGGKRHGGRRHWGYGTVAVVVVGVGMLVSVAYARGRRRR